MKNKIAIFICGSGGSGKSTFSKTYFPTYTIIDVDIIYEELLIEAGLDLKIKNFNNEQTKIAENLFEKAKSLNDKKFNDTITIGNNLVIDSIGRDSETIMFQRNYLEKMGYTTYMIMMYSELDVCIERVENRNRTYNKNITIDSWYLSYSNISIYKREFGKRFLLVYNDDMDWKSKFQIFIDNDINKKTIV
jgi:predicted kinase